GSEPRSGTSASGDAPTSVTGSVSRNAYASKPTVRRSLASSSARIVRSSATPQSVGPPTPQLVGMVGATRHAEHEIHGYLAYRARDHRLRDLEGRLRPVRGDAPPVGRPAPPGAAPGRRSRLHRGGPRL